MLQELRLPLSSRKHGPRKVALIDGRDIWAIHKRWHLCGDYPATVIDGRTVKLHRLIMQPPEGMVVDHINHDPLDNRRSNLRICTQVENLHNRRFVPEGGRGSSKYRGVSLNGTKTNPWRAYVKVKGTNYNLGLHPTEEAAAEAVARFWTTHPAALTRHVASA